MNIFLTQNLGKGPPGRTRSPVGTGCLKPDDQPAAPKSSDNQIINEKLSMNFNHLINIKNSISYKHLNSLIMKKQILFIAMFTLALIFAGSNHVFGQVYPNYVTGAPACVVAKPLVCATIATAPELSPTPGVSYTYTISTTPAAVGSVLWYVTDQNAVITAGALTPAANVDKADGTGSYILTAPALVYNIAGAVKTIAITWKNFDGNVKEVLLVAYVTGAAGCSDNVQVWRIKPVFNFTLDLMSMYDTGGLGTTVAPANECVSAVQSANYVGGATNKMAMDYGKNYIFFSVNAANFVGSWMPTITAAANTYGTIGTITWATPTEAVKNAAGVANGVWNLPSVAVTASGGAAAVVGQTGECIVVRVEVLNGNNEGLVANTITLKIDGVMYDPIALNYTNITLKDMDEPLVAGACVNNITDQADYIINPRPTITESNPINPSFIIKN